MGKRLNEKFLSHYMQLDKDCCDKFGIDSCGVTEYINRLNNSRFAPGRDDALPRLVRYRTIRSKMAHEVGSIKRSNEISKADIKWVKQFDRDIIRRKDPISRYLRKARRYVRRRRIRRIAVISAFAIVVLAAALLLIYLGIK